MSEQQKPRVLIIGAGSMGIIVGYHISLAGADVTFLIRPHRVKALDHPQMLYSYDDHTLKEYKDYTYFTDPSEMISAKYDYILVTLDGAALRNEVGQSLVKTIGEAARGTNTKVILGSAFFNLRSWFLQLSGLPAEQVTLGHLSIHIYATSAVTLPLHAPTNPELIGKADFAYSDGIGRGFSLDDSSPAVAEAFQKIYNASQVSHGAVKNAVEMAVFFHPIFAIFAACSLMDWPKFEDISGTEEPWTLAVAAVKEIQGLSLHGEVGQQAAAATTETGLLAVMRGIEKQLFPLDMGEFNRYHHGGKVASQDHQILHACLSYGEAEGKQMSALKELLKLVETR